MKVLGIDTSTACGSVGLIDDESVISDYLLNIPVTHSERLMRTIERVLQEAGWTLKDVNVWAISLGPGSFTGLRIGVSTIKGLSFATGRPVVGVPTLDVLAFQACPTPYLICPILDARKGELYTALYRDEGERGVKRLTPYRALRPEAVTEEIKDKTIFIGDGVKAYGNYLKCALPALALFPPSPFHLPRGSMVALRGLEYYRKGEHLDVSNFTPIYVRASEAEIKWQGKTKGKTKD